MSIRAMIVPAALLLCVAPVVAAPARRLPHGVQWGRCLLVVQGQTRIAGRCSYSIAKGGDFHIDGPRQLFDDPAVHTMAERRSSDYWADVFRDGRDWSGYGNGDIASVHGSGNWGVLRREGACYTGSEVRICLWRH